MTFLRWKRKSKSQLWLSFLQVDNIFLLVMSLFQDKPPIESLPDMVKIGNASVLLFEVLACLLSPYLLFAFRRERTFHSSCHLVSQILCPVSQSLKSKYRNQRHRLYVGVHNSISLCFHLLTAWWLNDYMYITYWHTIVITGQVMGLLMKEARDLCKWIIAFGFWKAYGGSCYIINVVFLQILCSLALNYNTSLFTLCW